MNIDMHLDAEPAFVICPVDDPVAVEKELSPHGLTIGDGWWASNRELQEQPDGRWKMYVEPISNYDTLETEPIAEAQS